MSTQHLQLGPTEVLPQHPVTRLEGTTEDVARLEYTRQQLCAFLSQPQAIPEQPRPYVIYLPLADDRRLRLALAQPERLLTPLDLTVVGFCGQKQPEADRTEMDRVDLELIAEFPQHRHLLAYCSLELDGGNWCNLVLFDSPQGISRWSHGGKHGYAAIELAPGYYQAIRLHNASLGGGIFSDQPIVLIRTKYYEYHAGQVWWAVREL